MGTGSVYTALDLEEGLEYLNSRVPKNAAVNGAFGNSSE
jgi:hypothetical protein